MLEIQARLANPHSRPKSSLPILTMVAVLRANSFHKNIADWSRWERLGLPSHGSPSIFYLFAMLVIRLQTMQSVQLVLATIVFSLLGASSFSEWDDGRLSETDSFRDDEEYLEDMGHDDGYCDPFKGLSSYSSASPVPPTSWEPVRPPLESLKGDEFYFDLFDDMESLMTTASKQGDAAQLDSIVHHDCLLEKMKALQDLLGAARPHVLGTTTVPQFRALALANCAMSTLGRFGAIGFPEWTSELIGLEHSIAQEAFAMMEAFGETMQKRFSQLKQNYRKIEDEAELVSYTGRAISEIVDPVHGVLQLLFPLLDAIIEANSREKSPLCIHRLASWKSLNRSLRTILCTLEHRIDDLSSWYKINGTESSQNASTKVETAIRALNIRMKSLKEHVSSNV